MLEATSTALLDLQVGELLRVYSQKILYKALAPDHIIFQSPHTASGFPRVRLRLRGWMVLTLISNAPGVLLHVAWAAIQKSADDKPAVILCFCVPFVWSQPGHYFVELCSKRIH